MPKKGEHVRYGGRQKGTPNKVTGMITSVRNLARDYTEECILLYGDVLRGYVPYNDPDSPSGIKYMPATIDQRMVAAERLMNRAHGMPTQQHKLSPGDGDDELVPLGDDPRTMIEYVRGVVLESTAKVDEDADSGAVRLPTSV